MTGHAILQPSAMNMTVNCGGSVPLQARQKPQDDTPENMEGNAAHWMAATQLKQLAQFGQAVPFKEGVACPNGVIITAEMIESVELFVDEVVEACGSDALEKMHIEEVLAITSIHPDNWGTPDVWWTCGPENRVVPSAEIWLRDYKHGHRFVDAFENWQLIDYLAGILQRPEFAAVPHDRIEVNLGIIQPRNYDPLGPIRVWKTTAAKLAPYFDRLRAACLNARGNDPTCNPGPWCGDCTARHACRALQHAADAAMDYAGSAMIQELTPAALGVELRMAERADALLTARLTGLQEQATGLLKNRVDVPGYEIEQGFGREAWQRPPEEIFALGDMMAVDLRKPPAPITPAQARKAGITKELVAGYAAQPIGKLKLKPTNTNLSRRIFQK